MQIQPNDTDVRTFEEQYQHNQNTPLPESLQIARLANATNYTYHDIGEPPCKCRTSSKIQIGKIRRLNAPIYIADWLGLVYTTGPDMKASIWAGLFSKDSYGSW
jgi:hypothetical protein